MKAKAGTYYERIDHLRALAEPMPGETCRSRSEDQRNGLSSPLGLAVYRAMAVLIACLGYVVFQKARRGFADVR
jgi:hypothetical protein